MCCVTDTGRKYLLTETKTQAHNIHWILLMMFISRHTLHDYVNTYAATTTNNNNNSYYSPTHWDVEFKYCSCSQAPSEWTPLRL